MHCPDIEKLLFAERDGALTDQQRADLARHVAACPACRELQSTLAAAAESWRTATAAVAVPDAEAEWRRLQPRLAGARSRPARRRLAPVIWLGAPLAAAAALAFAFLTHSAPAPETGGLARAEYVEAGNANASTLVYVDKESGWLVVWAVDTTAKTSG